MFYYSITNRCCTKVYLEFADNIGLVFDVLAVRQKKRATEVDKVVETFHPFQRHLKYLRYIRHSITSSLKEFSSVGYFSNKLQQLLSDIDSYFAMYYSTLWPCLLFCFFLYLFVA